MTMMSELPEDLLEEILCRVPARSLKRLRSTCKRWNGLFKDKRFTIKHFNKAAKQFMNLMLNNSRVCLLRNNLRRSPPVEVECELNLIEPHSSLDQMEIWRVVHCDGLLLCLTDEENTRLVVWNPCTGQTRWINCNIQYARYALGSYQDKKSNEISYKILSCNGYGGRQEFEINEINSNSWKILDVTLDLKLEFHHWGPWGVSLKGKTYWIARDEKELGKFLLVSFDYTEERFERLCLPRQYQSPSLSVVREEKLSVLSQCKITSKAEIWVTNKISETKAVSWSKVLALDLDPGFRVWHGGSFLFDEEKKVLVCCDRLQYKTKIMVYIVGEDNKVRKVDFDVGVRLPYLFNYVPSLIQI